MTYRDPQRSAESRRVAAAGSKPYPDVRNGLTQDCRRACSSRSTINQTIAPVQNTTINVNGSGDPTGIANRIRECQSRLNGDLIRNLKTAIG